ncbi:MAG TPA: peptide ABC transporter substrate-binding protein [Chlamydiales bacterium]|nr:peptide ABC transporter substrate-binding protein [Chlamydiales bacterium]
MFRLFFLLMVLCAGCQKSSAPSIQQCLRINIGKDPQSLDPRKARDLVDITITHMLFEGLTRTSKSGEIEMAIARDVEVSEDGTRYLFHLRNTVWSNGDPVTAFDFAESWRSLLDPHFPSDVSYQLYAIKNGRKAKLGEVGLDQVGIQTPDASTLIVELEQPIHYFLELVSMPTFFPIPSKIKNPNWALSPETYVGNGPFLLDSWKHGDEIHVSKNNRYWEAKKVQLQGIDLLMMTGDTEMQMFEEGKIDWAGSPLSTIPVDAVRTLRAKEKLHISPFSGTCFLRLNTAEKIGEKKNPLGNPLFRKALSFCLNRKNITDHILQGGQMQALSLVPPGMGLSEKGYFHDDHLDSAKSLLTDALLQLDLTLATLEPIRLSFIYNERYVTIAQAIQQQWEAGLGIRVELEAIEPKTFFKRISQREFQLAAGSWTADFNDPINFLEVFKYKDASTNNTNWENGKYIDLLNQSALCRDSEERKRLLREAEQILMEQMPIIPIFHFALNYLQGDGLAEVALSPLGQIDFRWAHFDNPSLEKR